MERVAEREECVQRSKECHEKVGGSKEMGQEAEAGNVRIEGVREKRERMSCVERKEERKYEGKDCIEDTRKGGGKGKEEAEVGRKREQGKEEAVQEGRKWSDKVEGREKKYGVCGEGSGDRGKRRRGKAETV